MNNAVITLQQSLLLRQAASLGEAVQWQAGALAEQLAGHALGQAQGIHQKLEGQLVCRQDALTGLENLAAIQIVLG